MSEIIELLNKGDERINLEKLFSTILSYKKTYRNYVSVLFSLYIKRKMSLIKDINLSVLLRDGRKLIVPYGLATTFARLRNIENRNISKLELTKDGISFMYKGVSLLIDLGRDSDLDTVFFSEVYEFLHVKNRDVIDIGMNIGDSVIYFSINGAKRVIGIEPYPQTYYYAEKNVRLNNIRNIVLLNAGYGRDTVITVSESVSGIGSNLVSSSKGKEIQILSLKTLINHYDLKDIVLKMDCEGCEYALINEDDEIFSNIGMIQIEYHYGCGNLLNKLKKCGYDVKFTQTKKFYSPEAENPNIEVGYIYAKKR